MIEYALLGFATFWLVLAGLVKKFNLESKGVTIIPLLFIMARTRRFLHIIDTLSEKAKSFWKGYSWLGVVVSVGGIPISLGYLALNAYKVIYSPSEATAVVPVIPGVTFKITWGLIIAIAVIFFVHEFSHGIVARREGINLKSMGVLLFIIVPGAFVEPDEDEMKKAPGLSRIKIYSAGSLGNFLTAGLFLIPLLLIPQVPDGILVYDTIPGMPAEKVLASGSIIYQVDGVDVKTYEEFSHLLSTYHPGDTITLGTNRGTFQITLTQNPSDPNQGFMGIKPVQHVKHFAILEIFSWISMLNLSVALFNLFPISHVLDGGKITDEILNHFFSVNTSRKLATAFGGVAVVILLINLLSNVIT